MENGSSNSELFSATIKFDNVTKSFKDGVELKNHNRRLKCYKNSFIASKGVDFLFNLLKSKEEFSNKTHRRDQAINLMKIYLRWGIIIKLYPTTNALEFQDNNKDLYTLGKSEDEPEMRTNVKKEPIYEAISKSTNDLINDNSVSNNSSFKTNRSIYRSFGKSTYSQIQSTIKQTTSTIIKSTNHNVTKFTNQTLNKFNNKSSSNLIKKLNNNLINKSNRMMNKLNSNLNSNLNSIKRSTSVLSRNTSNAILKNNSKTLKSNNTTSINRPSSTRSSLNSDRQQLDKENLMVNNNKKFQRHYRGHLSLNGSFNPTRLDSSIVMDCSTKNSNHFPVNQSQINSLSLNNQTFNSIPLDQPKLSRSLNTSPNYNVSLNPMQDEDNCYLTYKTIETEGNNLIRFLTKLSDGLKKKPLKPVNNTPLELSTNSSQIILNRDSVQYKPIIINQPILNQSIPNPPLVNKSIVNQSMPNQSMLNQSIPNKSIPHQSVPNQFKPNQCSSTKCLLTPYGSTCYNTLV